MKAVFLLAALGLTACSTSGSAFQAIPNGTTGATSGVREAQDLLGTAPRFQLNIALFDAPLANMPNVKVNVGLDGVQLLTKSGSVPFITNAQPQVTNLLDLQDHALNFNGKAPGGLYTGVRLLVNSANSNVTIGKATFPIVWGTPGHATTSPVIAVDFACAFGLGATNGTTKLTLDFNVMQSVRFYNGAIYVQPSVTAANAAGQVKGDVKNAAGIPVSSATVIARDAAGRIVNSTATKSDGTYVLHALPPGMYKIEVRNSFLTATGETVTAVNADGGAAPSQIVVLSPEDDLDLNTLID
ncbi:MAG: Carboxypeptidase regulatory-like domain [Candidatus Eremiobacteraeota bacterium]|nr:Carboxypeptidase regulatory-like domain [Candidatus Eremiobacteraeota bacterium]